MPLVFAYRDTSKVNNELFGKVKENLPALVAEALSTATGPLTPDDVEVWVIAADKEDIGSFPLSIIVHADLYPDRLADLAARQQKISDGIALLLPKGSGLKGFVWIRLAPGSFGTFQSR